MSLDERKKQARDCQKRLEHTYSGRAVRPVLSGLSLPEDASGQAARLTVLGEEKMLVENCRGISEMQEDCVRLLVPGGLLTICGEGLCLCDVRSDAMCVCGRLHRLAFPHAPQEARHD